MREEYSIYTIDTGRICVAALTTRNVDYVADALVLPIFEGVEPILELKVIGRALLQ